MIPFLWVAAARGVKYVIDTATKKLQRVCGGCGKDVGLTDQFCKSCGSNDIITRELYEKAPTKIHRDALLAEDEQARQRQKRVAEEKDIQGRQERLNLFCMSHICQKCGKEYHDSRNFCSKCGGECKTPTREDVDNFKHKLHL